jgi:adenylosuccinate synthase
MLVDPLALADEFEHLRALYLSDILDRLSIDRDALLVTPWHREANRIRETKRGADRHGSCGTGVGETRSYALKFPDLAPKVGDCLDAPAVAGKLALLKHHLENELGPLRRTPSVTETANTYLEFAHAVKIVSGEYLHDLLDKNDAVFEGAQGVLLDEKYGFPPYNTWSNTTFENAHTLLEEIGHKGYRLGVTRAYMTRHGAGPFPTEDAKLHIKEPHNEDGPWQGPVRFGHLDVVALRYALGVIQGVDGIAVTHLDTAAYHKLKWCNEYTTRSNRITLTELPIMDVPQPSAFTDLANGVVPGYRAQDVGWPKLIERELDVPVVMMSAGPGYDNKIFRPPLDLP